MKDFTEELRARKCQDIVSRLYRFCDVTKLKPFFAFSYLSVLNKAIIYNPELSYILKLICTIQLLLLVPVGNHNRISIILRKDTFV